jgi:hypothetical protein
MWASFESAIYFLLILQVTLVRSAPLPRGQGCDRACLLRILTIYTDAISLKNTSSIAVSSSVRITSNGNLTTLGDGLVWHTPGALRIPYRHALVDEVTGAATLRATISNETVPVTSTADEILHPPPGQWWWYVLRLQVVDGLITEIEEIATAIGIPSGEASSLTMPDRTWDTPVSDSLSRSSLFSIANDYFSTVGGTLPWQEAPFHPECNRVELGTQTTNAVFGPGSCGTEFLAPELQGGIVSNRRFYVAEEELGVVAALGWFGNQNGTQGTVVFEVFKIQDGLIRHIEAFFALGGQLYSGWGEGIGSGNS